MDIISSFSEFVILEDFFQDFFEKKKKSVFDKRKYLLGKLHRIICKCIKLSKIKTETIAVAFVKIIRAFLKKKPYIQNCCSCSTFVRFYSNHYFLFLRTFCGVSDTFSLFRNFKQITSTLRFWKKHL